MSRHGRRGASSSSSSSTPPSLSASALATSVSLFHDTKFQECAEKLDRYGASSNKVVEHNRQLCHLYLAATKDPQRFTPLESPYFHQLEAWVRDIRPCCPLWRYNLAVLYFCAGRYRKALEVLDPMGSLISSTKGVSTAASSSSTSAGSTSTPPSRRRGKGDAQQFSIRGGQMRSLSRISELEPSNEEASACLFHQLLGGCWASSWAWLTFECLLAAGEFKAALQVLDSLAPEDGDLSRLLALARQRLMNAKLLLAIERGAEPPVRLTNEANFLANLEVGQSNTTACALAVAHALYLRGRHQEAVAALLDFVVSPHRLQRSGEAGESEGERWDADVDDDEEAGAEANGVATTNPRSFAAKGCPQALVDNAVQVAVQSNIACLFIRQGKVGTAVFHAWQAMESLCFSIGIERPPTSSVFYNAGVALLLQGSTSSSTTDNPASLCLERAMQTLALTPIRALRLAEAAIANTYSTAEDHRPQLRFRITGTGSSRIVQVGLTSPWPVIDKQAWLEDAVHWCSEGLALLSRSVRHEPLVAIALNANVAYVFLVTSRFTESLTHARRALSNIADCPHPIDDQAAQLRTYRLRCASYAAEALCRLARPNEAIELLTATLESFPSSFSSSSSAAATTLTQTLSAQSLYNSAIAHLYSGRMASAVHWATKALHLNPTCSRTRVLLIYLHLLAGNRLDALDLLGLARK